MFIWPFQGKGAHGWYQVRVTSFNFCFKEKLHGPAHRNMSHQQMLCGKVIVLIYSTDEQMLALVVFDSTKWAASWTWARVQNTCLCQIPFNHGAFKDTVLAWHLCWFLWVLYPACSQHGNCLDIEGNIPVGARWRGDYTVILVCQKREENIILARITHA